MENWFTWILFLFFKLSGPNDFEIFEELLSINMFRLMRVWKNGDIKTMYGQIRPMPREVIVSNNFQALEEAIAEISETENISNEKEFFDLYEIKIMKLDQ